MDRVSIVVMAGALFLKALDAYPRMPTVLGFLTYLGLMLCCFAAFVYFVKRSVGADVARERKWIQLPIVAVYVCVLILADRVLIPPH
jgi:hypothetical protein